MVKQRKRHKETDIRYSERKTESRNFRGRFTGNHFEIISKNPIPFIILAIIIGIIVMVICIKDFNSIIIISFALLFTLVISAFLLRKRK